MAAGRWIAVVVLVAAVVVVLRWRREPVGEPGRPSAIEMDRQGSGEPEPAERGAHAAPGLARVPTPGGGEVPQDPLFQHSLGGIAGRCVDPQGNPLGGIHIEALGELAEVGPLIGDVEGRLERRGALTTDDGRFRIDGLMPWQSYKLRVSEREWYRDDAAWTEWRPRPMPGEVLDAGDVRLLPTATIVGRVVNADGMPVPAADVAVGGFGGNRKELDGRPLCDTRGFNVRKGKRGEFEVWWWQTGVSGAVRTDSAGRFRIVGVPPRMLLLSVRARGLPTSQLLDCAPGAVVDAGDLVLRRASTLRGRVVDAKGRPVVGADVLVAAGPASEWGLDGWLATRAGFTDAQGRFLAEDCPSGELRIAARQGAWQTWTLVEGVDPSAEVLVCLQPAYDVSLRVLDADGARVADPELRLFAEAVKEFWPLATLLETLRAELAVAEQIGPTGDGRLAIRGLSPASYRLEVRAPGRGGCRLPLVVTGNAELDVRLERRDGALEIETVDAHGRPVVGAWIKWAPSEEGWWRPAGWTDGRGRLAMERPAASKFRVFATHPAFFDESLDVADGQTRLRFTLRMPAILELRLVAKGARPAFEKWMLILEGPSGEVRADEEFWIDPSGRCAGRLPQKGRYRIASLDDESGESVPFEIEGATQGWIEVAPETTTRAVVRLGR